MKQKHLKAFMQTARTFAECSTAERAKVGAIIVKDDRIILAKVPGALESPLALKKMAQSKKFDALIALGAVIRGETFHFEVVANHSAKSIMDVQLEFSMPIVNAILTTENDEQAMERTSVKGAEAAQVAIQMIHLLKSV